MRLHTLSIPTPFPVGSVNVILIVDDPITLIDTGPKTDEAFAALRDQVQRCGISLDQIRRIILTHSHEDHAGQAARLQEISGALVFAHPWEASRLAHTLDDATSRRMLVELGVPEDALRRFEAIRRAIRALTDPVHDVRLLEDGQVLDGEHGSLEVIHTPGHTPGHIGLFLPERRVLIAGDTVLKRITPNPILNPDPRHAGRRFPSLSHFLATVNRLRALSPRWVITGHGEAVEDLALYCEAIAHHVHERQEAVKTALDEQRLTPWMLAQRLFPQARAEQQFLALSEAIAHLDFACSLGTVIREWHEGIEYYRLRR